MSDRLGNPDPFFAEAIALGKCAHSARHAAKWYGR